MADTQPLSSYVTLVSNDGYEFKLHRAAACIAGTIKKALDPACTVPPSPYYTVLTSVRSGLPRGRAEPRRAAHHQRGRAREGLRVPVLQPEERGQQGCARLGDSA
jgi:hypothetical protein